VKSSNQNLTTTERDTIAAWADKQLAEKITKGDVINHPAKWIAWRTQQLEAQALQDQVMRRQLARYADAWGINRTSSDAYRAPTEDIDHPTANTADVERWKTLTIRLCTLPADHWLRQHATTRLAEPRRPSIEDRTPEDEYRADAEALIVLAELEALLDQHTTELALTPPRLEIVKTIP
jgi:hypothetical protein